MASGPLLLLASSSGCCLRLFFYCSNKQQASPMWLEPLVVWLLIFFVFPFAFISNEDKR